jgi:hypothetical protein
VGLCETAGLDRTSGYSGSASFSASAVFTVRDTPYRDRRVLMELSGYVFFVFLYGDAA